MKGLVLISGRLRADARPDNPNAAAVRAYFGDDESLYEARSPVTYAAASQLPVFLAVAEYENPLLDVYGAETLHRIAVARGRAPRFLRLRAPQSHLDRRASQHRPRTCSAPRCATSSRRSR